MPSVPRTVLCLLLVAAAPAVAMQALDTPDAGAAGAELAQSAVPPMPGVVEQPDRIQAAVDTVVRDPVHAALQPGVVVNPLLEPSEPGDEQAPAPAPGESPGFADRVRDAFEDEVMMAGAASVLAIAASVGAFSLVTRYISPKEALENPQRAMLYGFVRGNPGVHLKKLSEEFAMKTSSILWHIRKLESAQLVRSERANGFRVFYPVEGGIEIRRVSRALSALQNANARAIFGLLDRSPGTSASDLGLKLGIHAGTVRWHLRKMREYGLAEELVRDTGSVFFATLLGRKALHTLEGAPVEPAPARAPSPLLGATPAVPAE